MENFDDIVNNSARESNVFKRLYKFSKEKVTKSSSFAIESVTDGAKSWQRKNSIVVSGNDDFISRSATNSPTKDPISHAHEEQGENIHRENNKVKYTSAKIHVKEEASKNERNQRQHNLEKPKTSSGKKTRKRVSAKETSSHRENSMIW